MSLKYQETSLIYTLNNKKHQSKDLIRSFKLQRSSRFSGFPNSASHPGKYQQSFTGHGMGPRLGKLLFFGFEVEQLQIPTVR